MTVSRGPLSDLPGKGGVPYLNPCRVFLACDVVLLTGWKEGGLEGVGAAGPPAKPVIVQYREIAEFNRFTSPWPVFAVGGL